MSIYIFGTFYAMLFVLLCKMFVEIFEVKRESDSKIMHHIFLVGLMLFIYSITIIFANNFIMKEIFILQIKIMLFHLFIIMIIKMSYLKSWKINLITH